MSSMKEIIDKPDFIKIKVVCEKQCQEKKKTNQRQRGNICKGASEKRVLLKTNRTLNMQQ